MSVSIHASTREPGLAGRQHAAVTQADRDYASSRRKSAILVQGGRAALILVVLTLWQAAPKQILDPFFFSRPFDMTAALARYAVSGDLWSNLGVTLLEACVGFCAGSLLGAVASVLLGSSARLYAIVEPAILILLATPAVALAPLVIVWLGVGLSSKFVLSAWFVFCIVLINGVAGIRSTPKGWIDAALLMGARPWQLYTRVKLRSAVPQFVVGLKAALPQALIGAMVGEFIAARRGLGYLIAQAAGKFDTAGVFAALFVLAALVLFMFVCLQAGSKALREPPR